MTIFAKLSTLDVWQGSENTSGFNLQLTFYDNLWIRTHRYFINFFRSMSNRRTPKPAAKVSLAFLCSMKLLIWSLSSVIHETQTVTLSLQNWNLTAYIESSEWLNIGIWLHNAKFGQRVQNHFSGKAKLTLKFFKKFLCILEIFKFVKA